MTLDFLKVPQREGKTRKNGITMVLDRGLSCSAAQDLMVASEWIDIMKLGWGTPLVLPEDSVKEKTRIYRKNQIEVSSGGTLLELAYKQEKVEEFLARAKMIGLTSIEVSNGKVDIQPEEKAEIIKKARNHGFQVYSEVGKKDPTSDMKLSLKQRIREAKSDLKAGARKVILEARESGKLGIYNKSGKIKEEFAKKLAKSIGLKNLIFEAPEKSQQVWLILAFGPEVNLGNIKPADVISLETLRKGLRGDTFGKIP